MKRQFNNIATLLKQSRIRMGLSQRQLARVGNFGKSGHQYVSNVERGKCSIPASRVAELADALSIDCSVIVKTIVLDESEYLWNAVMKYRKYRGENERH